MMPRYQRGNLKPYVKEEQTMPWQKDKQWSTKHYTGNYRLGNMDLTNNGVNSGTPEGLAVPPPLVPRYRNRIEEIILTKTLL